jgi:hypothetical protein
MRSLSIRVAGRSFNRSCATGRTVSDYAVYGYANGVASMASDCTPRDNDCHLRVRASAGALCVTHARTPPIGNGTPSSSTAVMVRGGCGLTQVLTGGVPGWLDDAGAHNNPDFLPYAVATPPTAAGFLFGYPLRAGHPDNPANKILWVVALPRGGSALVISAHPIGNATPVITTTEPAGSSGRDLPLHRRCPRTRLLAPRPHLGRPSDEH